MTDESIRTFDHAMLFVWQDELKATGDATVEEQCLQQESKLLPRFAGHHQKFGAF